MFLGINFLRNPYYKLGACGCKYIINVLTM